MNWVEKARRASARASVNLVKTDTVIGLGSGRTVSFVIKELENKMKREKLNFKVVPTSTQTEMLCARSGFKITNLVEHPTLDVAIDGADQVDVRTMNLIKGAGGALTREKIVAYATKKFAVVVDQEKVARNGLNGIVPIEVIPFSAGLVIHELIRMGGKPALRKSSGRLGPVVTDNGNYVIDVNFGRIGSPLRLDRSLRAVPGIVETGLFVGFADSVYIGRRSGEVQILKR